MTSLLPFCFVCWKGNSSHDTVPPNQSLSLFLDGEGKSGIEYFLVCYHRRMLPLKGFWRLFCVGVGLVLDRAYWHHLHIACDTSMNCGFCECGMLLVHTEYLCLPWWLWSNVSWLKCTCDRCGDQNQPGCGSELNSGLSGLTGMVETNTSFWYVFSKGSSGSCMVEFSWTMLPFLFCFIFPELQPLWAWLLQVPAVVKKVELFSLPVVCFFFFLFLQ